MKDLYIYTVILVFTICSGVYLIGTIASWITQLYIPKFTNALDVIVSLIIMFLMSFFILPLPLFMGYYIYQGYKNRENKF